MKRIIFFVPFLMLLVSCTTIRQGNSKPASLNDTWAVLPMLNNTETPYAADKAEAVTVALLYAKGVRNIMRYPGTDKDDGLLDRGQKRQADGLSWAKGQQVKYILSGAVNEWRYKVGLDGEPVAGFTFQLMEMPEGKVIWSSASGKSGWSRDAVSSVAQQVIDRMLETIPFK
jgi:hypothetical protein